jgi:DUF438 domain-containing protein
MSELLDNSKQRKVKLKALILALHEGTDPEKVKTELKENLSQIPYGEVVEVEQELIEEGLPEEEILRLCDVHSEVLEGRIDLSAIKIIPPGHPVDVFKQENKMLVKVVNEVRNKIENISSEKSLEDELMELKALFNQLTDVDKHYQRKEYLLFPYLEQKGITGPPKVMWGKHDEIRELIKGSLEVLQTKNISSEEMKAVGEILLLPSLKGIEDMTGKENEILFPMSLDTLSESEWYQIHLQTMDIGYCLYDPPFDWKPSDLADEISESQNTDQIKLPSGSFTNEELLAILNTLPVDITFVDKNDKVKFFSQAKERIFTRSRSIINRDVRNCHPPASAHIVDKIIDDFRSGRQKHAPFWINMGGKFIHIEYFALRNPEGEYLGTLEVSQNLSDYRKLEGEQRILSYK